MLRKLAVFRRDTSDPCPFGLGIAVGCQRAGHAIHRMVPLETAAQVSSAERDAAQDYNLALLREQDEPAPCPFANKILSPTTVECSFSSEEAPSDALLGSSYYQKLLSNTSLTGLYNYPTGTVSDVSVNPGPAAGDYSFEGVASDNNTVLIRHSMKDSSMSLAKISQLNLDGVRLKPQDLPAFDDIKDLAEDASDLRVDLEISPETEEEVILLDEGEELSGELLLELDGEDLIEKEFSFLLPKVPGAEDQEDLAPPEPEIQVEDDENIEVEVDPWKWTLATFMQWLAGKMQAIPPHSGKDIVGLERAIAFMKRLVGEIRKASIMDFDNVLNVNTLEKARQELLDGIDRLEERQENLEKLRSPRRKKASLIKEAKAGGFTVNTTVLVSGICRILINGTVSGGHDMGDMFQKLSKRFDLTKREQFEVLQILQDMGYPLRWDRGVALDEKIDPTSTDNFDWSAQYLA